MFPSPWRYPLVGNAPITFALLVSFATPISGNALIQVQPGPISSRTRCVSIVGDSLAGGDTTFKVPLLDFVPVQTVTIAMHLGKLLPGWRIYNRSAVATGISSANHRSFRADRAYKALLADRCAYTVILPWLNDLSPALPGKDAAVNHIDELTKLAAELRAVNPSGRIVLLDYYLPNLAEWTKPLAPGFTNENVALYNQLISYACQTSSFRQQKLACYRTSQALSGLKPGSITVGATSRTEFYADLAAPPNQHNADVLGVYWRDNPKGLIYGDGLHLTRAAKQAIARFLAQIIQKGK